MIKGTKKSDFKGKVLHVIHNKEKSPFLGERFGQDVEPTGYFCTQKETNQLPENWEEKKIILNNPLIVDVAKDRIEWKRQMAKKHSAVQKNLTKKLMKLGFDGIITTEKSGKWLGYTGEIIVFDVKASAV